MTFGTSGEFREKYVYQITEPVAPFIITLNLQMQMYVDFMLMRKTLICKADSFVLRPHPQY